MLSIASLSTALAFMAGALSAILVWLALRLLPGRSRQQIKPDSILALNRTFSRKRGGSRGKLLESEKRFHTLVNNIPGAFYRCHNRDGWRMIYLSNYIHQITGYDASEFIDNKVRSYDSIISKEDRMKVNNVIRDGLLMEDSYVLEYRIVHKSGAIRWVYEKGRSIISLDGENLLDGVIFDITDRKIFEEQLKKAQKMELIGTLASGYAHDMNNILGGITASSSFIEYLLANGESVSNQRIREHISVVGDCVTRATNAIGQLLRFNSIDDLSYEHLDLKAAIENTVKLCRLSFDKSVKIVVSLPEQNASIMGDQDQIQQVVLNLMINAEHSMTSMRPPGERWGGTLKVQLSPYRGDILNYYLPSDHMNRLWHILIEDEGIGIEKGMIDDIFTPFFTTKKQKGTGLGLSMVNHLVMNHNGVVKVESKPGIGSRFHILLPQVSDFSLYNSQPKSFLSVPKGEGHILVIDDEKVMRKLGKEMLIQCGYQVTTASTGEEALKIYKEDPRQFNLVILDLVLPDISGDELMTALKGIREIKVLLASGFISDERIGYMTSHGLNGYIHKPYSISSLSEKVSEILQADLP